MIIYCICFVIQLVSANFDEEMFWGTYKPQLLHGISQRNTKTYNPLTVALMYYDELLNIDSIIYKVPKMDTANIKVKINHHNGRDFNQQTIKDPFRKCEIQNTWLKLPLQSKLNWVEETIVTENEKSMSLLYVFTVEQFNTYERENRVFIIDVQEKGILLKIQDDSFFITIHLNNTQIVHTNDTNISILKLFQTYTDNWDPSQIIFESLSSEPKIFDKHNIIAIKVNLQINAKLNFQIQQSNIFVPQFVFANFQQLAGAVANLNKFRFKQTFNTDNTCAYESFTNLMAGLQFSYGDLDCTVQRENCQAFKAMLTHTPSRKGFPRPFLWDEGFHNMIACKMNPDICLQSLEDWVNTMSEDGWIPREQPRNEELRSYIPGLKEDPRESNPPTFFFDFSYLVGKSYGIDRIGVLYPKLKRWYTSWFETQAIYKNNEFSGFLKWWGPDEENNLGSGLDDWPRKSDTKVSKYNIDAQAWGYFFCEQMVVLAKLYDQSYVSELESRMEFIRKSAKEQMLDRSDGIYKDILHEMNTIDENQYYSPHRGYPNLLPLALGMIDNQETFTISNYLKFMKNEQTIWTKYGLRSLELNNPYFGVGSNYWRGPIWINIQYLVLRGLKLYYWELPGVQTFYKELRDNMIQTVCSQYDNRGYFYEHYNQKLNGQGRGNAPFNGWTSLITLVIAEIY